MKTEIINLDKIVSVKVHSPRVDGFPIYGRVDNQIERVRGETDTRSDKWNRTVETKYNSPSNVKRVFITHAGVYVHLHCPITGVSGRSLRLEKKFTVDFMDVYRHHMEYLRGNTQVPKYKVRGLGITAIQRPWVCSNVEEVYFDWTILLSEAMWKYGVQDGITEFGPGSGRELPMELLRSIVTDGCMGGVRNLKARYPRLRGIGYIQDLESIYQNERPKHGAESLEELKVQWLTPQIRKSFRTITISTDVTRWDTNRSTKPNMYKFDRDILEPYFENLSLREKTKQLEDSTRLRESRVEAANKEKIATQPKRGIEELLDSIMESGGEGAVKKSIALALKRMSRKEREETLSTLTEEGKLKYKREWFGLNDK